MTRGMRSWPPGEFGLRPLCAYRLLAACDKASSRSHTALFVNTYPMLQHIDGGRADGTLEQRFQT